MDEDIKPLLAEIVEQLKSRNQMIRDQQEQSERMKTELFGKMSGFSPGLDMEETRDAALKQIQESRGNMARIQEDAARDRQEQREFRAALIEELRKLNANFEKFFSR